MAVEIGTSISIHKVPIHGTRNDGMVRSSDRIGMTYDIEDIVLRYIVSTVAMYSTILAG